MAINQYGGPVKTTYDDTYVSQYVAKPFELMGRAAKAKQAQHDANQAAIADLDVETDTLSVDATNTRNSVDEMTNEINTKLKDNNYDYSLIGGDISAAKKKIAGYLSSEEYILAQENKAAYEERSKDKTLGDLDRSLGIIDLQKYDRDGAAKNGQRLVYQAVHGEDNSLKEMTDILAKLKESGDLTERDMISGDLNYQITSKKGKTGVFASPVSKVLNSFFNKESVQRRINDEFKVRVHNGEFEDVVDEESYRAGLAKYKQEWKEAKLKEGAEAFITEKNVDSYGKQLNAVGTAKINKDREEASYGSFIGVSEANDNIKKNGSTSTTGSKTGAEVSKRLTDTEGTMYKKGVNGGKDVADSMESLGKFENFAGIREIVKGTNWHTNPRAVRKFNEAIIGIDADKVESQLIESGLTKGQFKTLQDQARGLVKQHAANDAFRQKEAIKLAEGKDKKTLQGRFDPNYIFGEEDVISQSNWTERVIKAIKRIESGELKGTQFGGDYEDSEGSNETTVLFNSFKRGTVAGHNPEVYHERSRKEINYISNWLKENNIKGYDDHLSSINIYNDDKILKNVNKAQETRLAQMNGSNSLSKKISINEKSKVALDYNAAGQKGDFVDATFTDSKGNKMDELDMIKVMKKSDGKNYDINSTEDLAEARALLYKGNLSYNYTDITSGEDGTINLPNGYKVVFDERMQTSFDIVGSAIKNDENISTDSLNLDAEYYNDINKANATLSNEVELLPDISIGRKSFRASGGENGATIRVYGIGGNKDYGVIEGENATKFHKRTIKYEAMFKKGMSEAKEKATIAYEEAKKEANGGTHNNLEHFIKLEEKMLENSLQMSMDKLLDLYPVTK